MSAQSSMSAGIIPFHRNKNEIRFLILRSYNYWDFPKGLVEKSENPLQAARRELREETGIAEVQFPLGETYTETAPYSRGKVARYYLGEVDDLKVVLGVNPELGRAEHHEYRWVTFKEAEKLFVPRLRQVIEWAEDQLSG